MKNQKVLIVGGNSGVGLSLAIAVSKLGAKVHIAARSQEKHQQNVEQFPILEQAVFHTTDITQQEKITKLFEDIGRFDHLAITVKSPLVVAPFVEQNQYDVMQAFDTKFWGQYLLVKSAYQHLSKSGSITLSSGTLGKKPHAGFSTMSVISGAIDSLCKALAIELAPIRVNSVSPGFKTLKELEDKIPLGLGNDAQISNPYLFLMQDSYITGETIVTDGGALLV